jgi:gluconolactonase
MGASKEVCVGFAYRYGYNEGPTWIASQNAFFFSNFVQGSGRNGDIIKYSMATGQCENFIMDAGTNGLAVNSNGKLLGATHLTASITEFDLLTKEKKIIANKYMGQNFDSPNDLVVHSNGTIYFTNPEYERLAPGFGVATFRIDPMGVVSLIARGQSNGIALSPDEKKLYVVQAGVWSLDADGVPTEKDPSGAPGGDGISVDCAGRIFNVGTNSAFGGADGKTLFVVEGRGARTIQMTVPGLP